MKAIIRLKPVPKKIDGMKVVAYITPTHKLRRHIHAINNEWFSLGIGIWRNGNTVNGLPYTDQVLHFVGEVVLSTRVIEKIIPPIEDDWGYLLDKDLVDKEVTVKTTPVGKQHYFKIVREDDSPS